MDGTPSQFQRAFGCDLRSLAAMRIGLGVLLIAGLLWRLPEFGDHYTDSGAWPVEAAKASGWSVYCLSGEAWHTGLWFCISALAAIALAAGWHTRVSTAVSWILLISLQNRNDPMLNGGDFLLRLLLFWGLFLPLGERWSLDALARQKRSPLSRPPVLLVSVPTVALLLQVAMVYVFNALYKNQDCWIKTGAAIEDALKLETYSTALARWLLDFPTLLKWSTFGIWWFELLGPLLAFVPWKNSAFRMLAVVLFLGFHAGKFMLLRIGLFPLVGMVAWLPFLPAVFWDKVGMREENRAGSQPIALQAACGIPLLLVLYWNIAGFLKWQIPGPVKTVVHRVRLDQKWQLFAPPFTLEGWFVPVIECDDGQDYDPTTGELVNWARPVFLGSAYPSVNWRKFLTHLRMGPKEKLRWYCAWLQQKWESSHPGKRVLRIRLHFLWEYTAKRQKPPGNLLVYENPEGPMTALAKKLATPASAGERGDN